MKILFNSLMKESGRYLDQFKKALEELGIYRQSNVKTRLIGQVSS